MKDDLFYVQPVVEYATLSDYNHVRKLDFPKRNQPSSMFPTLPDVSPVVPLDALTHHTDRNYPTVNHAYGPFHRPKYYVGKCPSNQFVRNFDTPPPTTTPSPTIESYTGSPSAKPISQPIKFNTEYTYKIETSGNLKHNIQSGVGNNTFTTTNGQPTTYLSYNDYVIKPFFASLPTSCSKPQQVVIKYTPQDNINSAGFAVESGWTPVAFSNNSTTSLSLGNSTIKVKTGKINCSKSNVITVPMTFYQS